MKKQKIMSLICAVMFSCGIVTACDNKKKTPENPPVPETEIMGYRPAGIELSDDFAEIISLDKSIDDIYIFGQLKTGGYVGYTTDGTFSEYKKINFVPQNGEIVKSSAVLPFGKKAVLTYLDGDTMIYIYGTDGMQEKALNYGKVIDDPETPADIFPYGRDGYIINIGNKRLAKMTNDGFYELDIEVDGDILGVARGADNTVNCLYDNGKAKFIAGVDINACCLTDMKKVDISSKSYASCMGEKYTYIGVFEDGIYGFKDSTTEKITDFKNMDFQPSDVTDIVETDDGYAVSLKNGGMYFITEDNISELKAKKVIWVGHIGKADLYSEMRKLADAYNENHADDEYKVDFKEYSKSWEGGDDELNTDILSGNAPDIVPLIVPLNTYYPLDNFRNSNELFADLYPLLDSDPELSREDFLPNILEGLEHDGRLLQLGTSFSVHTVPARASAGIPENWSVDDMIEVYNNLPENTRLFNQEVHLRISYFSELFNSDFYVDYDKAECNFDSPDFIKYIKFFQENEIGLTYEEYEKTDFKGYDTDMTENYVLRNYDIWSASDLHTLVKGEFQDDVVLAGYVGDGKKSGTSLYVNDLYAISANSPNIDGAWDFFKTLFSEKYYNKYTNNSGLITYYSYNFPVTVKKFDEELYTYTRDYAHVDYETGKTVIEKRRYYPQHIADDEHTGIEMDNFTPEECEYYKNKILSAKVARNDYTVFSTVSHEVENYFEGEGTAEQTVENIQKKVSEYLSENYK